MLLHRLGPQIVLLAGRAHGPLQGLGELLVAELIEYLEENGRHAPATMNRTSLITARLVQLAGDVLAASLLCDDPLEGVKAGVIEVTEQHGLLL